jgi:hypothetical protein
VSAGWEGVAELCRDAQRDLEELVAIAVDRIRAELRDYDSVPAEEHRTHVRGQYEALLGGLADRRHPGEQDAERARGLGARRARQGLPLEAVVSAYHIGYRELWNALVERAELEDPTLAVRLLRLVNLVWTWVQRASAAAADGYTEVQQARHVATVELGLRFVEALYGGDVDGEDVALAARALGFDPDGPFRAVCTSAGSWTADAVERLRGRIGRDVGAHAAVRGSMLVLVTQDEAVTAPPRLVELLGTDPFGVGTRRPGLAGAAASVADAERCLAVARRAGRPSTFDEDWLVATLLPHRHELAPLLGAEVTEIADRHPHLADAVAAYAGRGFSVTAAASALLVHPNTVKYRLDRWRELTGQDPRTLDGLTRSLLGIELYRRDPDGA